MQGKGASHRTDILPVEHTILVAIVGSGQSGKSALTEALSALAETQNKAVAFTEIHDLDDLHACRHDVVLQVVDCTDLEDSLMLTPHIIDESHKIVLAFNRYDLLSRSGHRLDVVNLKRLMGVPLEVVNATSGEGLSAILQDIECVYHLPESTAHPIYHAWEQEDDDAYRAHIHGVLHQTLTHPQHDTHSTLEKVDRVLTNKWFGFPILAAILFFVFECTFLLGEPIQHWMQAGIDALYGLTMAAMPSGWLSSLLADGIILGVGSLLTALPNIIILFFFLSMMEDTGYMARVAFLMDGVMHRLGLHGRSFIPMLMGFDCNVPAIMAAKDIRDPKDRALTMLMVPFMSCSARLPVYVLFIGAFFPHHKALVLLSLYLLGILLSFVFALVMKRTRWFRKQEDDSVNELPSFKLPSIRSIGGHIRYRVEDFLKKISTVVLCASVIIWALEFFPACDLEHIESSWLAVLGRWIEPVMQPLGFDWKMSVCLMTGLPAKEAIVSTLSILYGGDITLAGFSPVSAYAFLVFTLLYFPCVATIATIRRELRWQWAMFTVVNSVLLAWFMSWLVNVVGSMLLGVATLSSLITLAIIVMAVIGMIVVVGKQRESCDMSCSQCPLRKCPKK